jgi:hypothetical protein
MNNYISFEGKRYITPAKTWQPTTIKPSNVRPTLLGGMDATYGPATILEWSGLIEAPVTATAPWGAIADLRGSLRKRAGVSFTDHYGYTYTVHVIGPTPEKSNSPKWDAPSNKIYISVVFRTITAS